MHGELNNSVRLLSPVLSMPTNIQCSKAIKTNQSNAPDTYLTGAQTRKFSLLSSCAVHRKNYTSSRNYATAPSTTTTLSSSINPLILHRNLRIRMVNSINFLFYLFFLFSFFSFVFLFFFFLFSFLYSLSYAL